MSRQDTGAVAVPKYQRRPGEALDAALTKDEVELLNEYEAIKAKVEAWQVARGKVDQERIEYHRRQLWFLKDCMVIERCEKIHADGRRCGSPKMKSGRLCYAHQRAEDARPKKLKLELMADANAVILNLALVQKAMLDGQITPKEAGQLFYSIHTAAIVLDKVTIKNTKPDEMITETPDEEAESLWDSEGSDEKSNVVDESHTEGTDENGADRSTDESKKSFGFKDDMGVGVPGEESSEVSAGFRSNGVKGGENKRGKAEKAG